MKKAIILILTLSAYIPALSVLILMSGCGNVVKNQANLSLFSIQPSIDNTTLPTVVPTVMATAIPTAIQEVQTHVSPRINRMKSYVVKKGDCLWNIAKKKSIYNNPWDWPLIYRQNIEIIINPNLIYTKQVLSIPTKFTKKQERIAIKEAREFK